MIKADELDRSFVEEIMAEPGGEHLITCWSCGTCAATCLVRRYEPSFNPRIILHKAGLGLRDEVLSSAEIWQCSACDICYPRCPKEIHISDVMAAIRNVAIREGYERPGVTAEVDIGQCTACGMCVAACPYEAIVLQTVQWNRTTKRAAQVDASLCMACGICSATCPSLSISVESNTDSSLYRSALAALRSTEPLPGVDKQVKVLSVVCNWCLRSEADLAYTLHPPEGVVVVNVPCSGRVAPTFIMTALQHGADAVVVVGCREDECHYKHGNLLERRRVGALRALLDMVGVERARVRFFRLGSLDRGRLSRLVDEAMQDVLVLEHVAEPSRSEEPMLTGGVSRAR